MALLAYLGLPAGVYCLLSRIYNILFLVEKAHFSLDKYIYMMCVVPCVRVSVNVYVCVRVCVSVGAFVYERGVCVCVCECVRVYVSVRMCAWV